MGMTHNLLSRRATGAGQASGPSHRLPAYLVVEASDPQSLAALTPRLMRWADDLWVLDLSLCAGYWQARAAATGSDVVALVKDVLQQALATDDESPAMRAALADHPWQGLLLITQMRERRLTGLVSLSGPFGEALFRDLSWETWWTCAETLAEHLQGRRRFSPVQFRSQCAQMQRAVARLDFKGPSRLREVDSPALQRRFGAVLRDMALWAFDNSIPAQAVGLFARASASEALFESGFPWQSFVFTSLPRVMRHLETPVCEWSHMEALLREDFDRLAGLACWQAGEKVVSLEWQLVLVDLAHLTVPIRFRHPHPLHLEKGCHATALLQALYSFESSPLGSRKTAAQAAEEGELYKAVIGWTLVITERLTLPPRSTGLFGDQAVTVDGRGVCDPELLSLLAMENKLRVPLESYALRADWLPEDSYDAQGSYALAATGFAGVCSAQQRSLTCVAAERPLYLYAKPQSFDSQGASSIWRFQERTMNKWWVGSGAERSLQRDYYRLTDKDQRDLWVFKDGAGQWSVHGVYA